MSWLGAAIIVLLLAWAFRLGLLAYAMYALITVMLASRVLTKSWADNLAAQREISRTEVDAGEQVAILATISNAGALPIAWVLVEDLLPLRALIYRPPSLQVSGRRILVSGIGPRASKRLMYQLVCHRRGYYQLGPLVGETGDLFGLHRRYRVLSKPTFLTVMPKVVGLDGYDIASRRPLGEVRLTHRLYEDPTRNGGVREYERGDPLNRVHWGATARTGQLHSKIYEPSTVAGATILLDFHLSTHPPEHEPMRSELAVTTAASLLHMLYEMGQQAGLITNGRDAADRVREEGWEYDLRTRDAARKSASMVDTNDRLRPQVLPPARGPDHLRRLRLALARVELTDGLQFDQLILETACRMPKDATVIAILQQVKETYAVALGNLRRQGYAVAAILNVHAAYDFAQASKHLLVEGIPTHHLINESAISTIAKRQFFDVQVG